MQELRDIFGLWDSIGSLASAINRKYDTVLAWRIRGRIPEDAWGDVVAAATKIGKELTISDLYRVNGPMGKRGRAPRKIIGSARQCRAS